MPTPMPIIVATDGAQSGTSTTLASRAISPEAMPTPKTAVSMRQAHGQQRAEAHEQDHAGDEEADAFGADRSLLGVLHGLAGQFDLDSVVVGSAAASSSTCVTSTGMSQVSSCNVA